MALVGYNTIGANDSTLATSTLFNPDGLQVVIPDGGTVTKASAAVKNTSGSHNFNIAIFNDSAGTRGTLVSTSNVSANVGTTYAFVDVTFTSPPTLLAGTYWLQVAEGTGNPGTTLHAFDTGGASNTGYQLSDLGVPQYNTNKYSVTLTYTPSSIPSTPATIAGAISVGLNI